MTAVVPNKVEEIDARVDSRYGTSVVQVKLVYIDVTTDATSNTTDINTYVDCTGILGVVMDSIDGANNATKPTWSGTTVTWAGHAGSGGTKVILAIY